MDIEDLRSFINLAETLNFAKAAKKENTTQPTLSRRIKKIERELGTLLFTRDSRNVALTNAGMEFYFHITKLVEQYDLAVNVTKDASLSRRRRLRIGIGYYEHYLLANFIGIFARKYPDVRMDFYQFIYEKLYEHFIRGNLDVILTSDQFISFHNDNFTKMEVSLLWDEEWSLAINKDHELAPLGRIRRDMLEGQTLISMYQGSTTLIQNIYKNQLYDAFRKIIRVNSYETKLLLVDANIGIGFIPSFVKTGDFPNVVLRKLDPPYRPRKFYIICKKDNYDLIVKDFFDMCLKYTEIEKQKNKTSSENR